MKKKSTTTKKAAAKRAPKPAAPIIAAPVATALHFQEIVDSGTMPIVVDLLHGRTATQLKEYLRSRRLPIPKDKTLMVARLAEHLGASVAVLTVSIA